MRSKRDIRNLGNKLITWRMKKFQNKLKNNMNKSNQNNKYREEMHRYKNLKRKC